MNATAVKPSLNDQIRDFNHEVYEYEKKQEHQIAVVWDNVQQNYLDNQKISPAKAMVVKQAFKQALANLSGMLKAKTLYEAELYHKSYVKALKTAMTPRRDYVLVQTQVLDLLATDHDFPHKCVVIKTELQKLELRYKNLSHETQVHFSKAYAQLETIASSNSPEVFRSQKTDLLNTLADIHETVNTQSEAERACDKDIQHAIKCSKSLITARSSYLDDNRARAAKIEAKATSSWIGLGSGLALGPASLIIAATVGLVAAPIIGIVVGIGGAVYGAADILRTTAEVAMSATTTTLGKLPIPKPKPSLKQRLTSFVKKAAPVALCVAGAVVAIAGVIVTAGIGAVALAGFGAVCSAAGVGSMAYDKYSERKEITEIHAVHKELNQEFTKAPAPQPEMQAEPQNELADQLQDQHQFLDSMDETISMLAGEKLNKAAVETMQEDLVQQHETINKPAPEVNVTPTVVEKVQDFESEDDEGSEGTEGEGEGAPAESSSEIPSLKF